MQHVYLFDLISETMTCFHVKICFIFTGQVNNSFGYDVLLSRSPLFIFYVKGGLNLSSSQPQLQPRDNRTIQNFVKDYVHEYVGGYTTDSNVSVLSVLILEYVTVFQEKASLRWIFLSILHSRWAQYYLDTTATTSA